MFSSLSNAQQPSYFLFGEKQFEGVDIYNVIQDLEFNYWFATDQGIFMHDGYSFTKVECDEMKASSVFNFIIDDEGIIYCHNLNQQVFKIENGICSFFFEIPDLANDIFIQITPQQDLFLSTSRNVFIIDRTGQIKLSTSLKHAYFGEPHQFANKSIVMDKAGTDTIIVYKDGVFHAERINKSKIKNAQPFEILTFFDLNNQSYAINKTNHDIFKFDISNYSLESIGKSSWKKSNDRFRFYELENDLWIASGLFGCIHLTNKIQLNLFPENFFSNYFISHVYKDKEGNILLSTFDEGIIVIPDISLPDVERKLMPYSITRIQANSSGKVHLGTRSGQLLEFDSNVKELTGKGNKVIETLFSWEQHPFVFSDNNGLSITNLNTGKTTIITIGSLKAVARIGPNQLLLGLNSNATILNFDPATDEFTKGKTVLAGRIYVVENESGTGTIYISSAQGLHYMKGSEKCNLIKQNGVTINALCMKSFKSKTLISTRKKGFLYLSKGKIVGQFFPKYLSENLMAFKFLIHEDKIYANTQIGLVVMDLQGNILHFVNKSSGLSTNKIIDFDIANDHIWIAHSRGVQRFKISEITAKVLPPQLFLKQIFINNQPVSTYTDAPSFSSDQSRFRFILRVPTLKHRENIRYHYKLDGIQENWHIEPYEHNEINYQSLGPGKYRLIIKAENNGVFSEPIEYSFTISAPFYQQWWFIITLLAILLLIIIFIFKRLLTIQRKKAIRINELNASRLTAIQSQMNPHFIFNALNSIQDLVLKGDIDNSYSFITKFSNLIRRTLNYSDKDFIEFEQEIKLIELYLSLEKLRFKDDIEFTLETNNIDDILIPPMLIQPFIENAFVHGLLHKEGLKKLKITFYLNEHLICEIVDNGIGRKKAMEIQNRQRVGHESFAVNAIKKRFDILEGHFKGELGFQYKDLYDGDEAIGTKVIIKIPINKKY